jgi:catechol 2,3-dioxygenase-like lactoylglutathione lyase family enzyme
MQALPHHGGMSTIGRLAQFPIVAFVNIRDAERAKAFYRDTLGLTLIAEELPFALVFDANGTMLRLAINPQAQPIAGTVLGWRVPNIQESVQQLASAAVIFERWEFMQQDELGIWTTPIGAKVAWFKDPDGNLLSLSQFPV